MEGLSAGHARAPFAHIGHISLEPRAPNDDVLEAPNPYGTWAERPIYS